ncbi:DUF6228 family protein [Cellulosimicrobium sp. I38E]|uniref:DUF6228 family protein n=1 Tax=Cellulosimicrobium sp. I38E TaxID=1393139 RepID=UPI001C6560BD|nr:DUF6228 family protein [Cellulosimicrobium sp. I38E]
MFDQAAVRIPASTGLTLEFEQSFPYGPDDPYVSGMLVRAVGDHLQVEQRIILSLGSGGLSAFLYGLYDEFRGWTGERTWQSLEDELRVVARHDGHVHLRWEVTNRPYNDDSWTFSTTTHHGAGEDVRRIADAFHALLDTST